ncbi:MAG: MFS transporter [Caldilineaceae bacterium]
MMHEFGQRLRLFRREVWLYLVTPALIGFTVFGGIYTVLLNLYLLRLGYDAGFVGLVNAAGFGTLAVAALPVGAVGRVLGVRRAMILGMVLMMSGCALLPLAEFVPAFLRPGWLLATYALIQLGMTLHIVNSQPFLMDATTPAEREHVFSVQVALWPLAGFVGSMVGGLLPGLLASLLGTTLADPAPYRYTLFLAAVLILPGVWALTQIPEAEAPPTGHLLSRVATGAPMGLIVLLATISYLRGGGEGVGRTFFNVYLDDGLGVSTAQIGSLLAFAQLLAVPSALMAPALVRRWGKERLMLAGTFGVAVSLLPMAFIADWRATAVGLLGILLDFGLARPFAIYIQEVVEPQWRPLISGATTMTFGLSWFTTAPSGGYIIATLGYRELFLVGALLNVAGGLLLWSFLTLRQRRMCQAAVSMGD